MLIAWSGFAYIYHIERSSPDHDSPTQLAKEIADHSGKLEKTCDHCCHGGSHTQALCSESLSVSVATSSTFETVDPLLFHTRASPPLTPPPQA